MCSDATSDIADCQRFGRKADCELNIAFARLHLNVRQLRCFEPQDRLIGGRVKRHNLVLVCPCHSWHALQDGRIRNEDRAVHTPFNVGWQQGKLDALLSFPDPAHAWTDLTGAALPGAYSTIGSGDAHGGSRRDAGVRGGGGGAAGIDLVDCSQRGGLHSSLRNRPRSCRSCRVRCRCK